jgi:TnpA family transposase
VPGGSIDTPLIATLCEEILRVVATIKLKKARTSQLCKRLNTDSRQHPLCQALKEFGKLRKPEFPLHFIDDVTLRQAVEIQFDKGEHANKFSKAVSFVTHHNFLHGEYDFSDEKPLDSIALRIYTALPFPAKEGKREKVSADLHRTQRAGRL